MYYYTTMQKIITLCWRQFQKLCGGQSVRFDKAAFVASRTLRLPARSPDCRYPWNTSCIWYEEAATDPAATAHELRGIKQVPRHLTKI